MKKIKFMESKKKREMTGREWENKWREMIGREWGKERKRNDW